MPTEQASTTDTAPNPFEYTSLSQETPPQHTRTLSDSLPRPQLRHHRPSLPAYTTQPDIPVQSNPPTMPNLPAQCTSQCDFDDTTFDNTPLFGDLLIETQDVDMSLLGLDMLPWFDATSADVFPAFDNDGDGFGVD